MRQNNSEVIVLVTTKTANEAKKLGKTVVSEQLAACVNIIGTCKSLYRWNGKVEESAESLLIIKTTRRRYQDLQKRIKSLHSYTVPEVIAISIVQGLPDYLAWIRKSVHK
ncbi:MAG: divalent-cation tolerance protein CutA [Nitrospiraceae bacterium]